MARHVGTAPQDPGYREPRNAAARHREIHQDGGRMKTLLDLRSQLPALLTTGLPAPTAPYFPCSLQGPTPQQPGNPEKTPPTLPNNAGYPGQLRLLEIPFPTGSDVFRRSDLTEPKWLTVALRPSASTPRATPAQRQDALFTRYFRRRPDGRAGLTGAESLCGLVHAFVMQSYQLFRFQCDHGVSSSCVVRELDLVHTRSPVLNHRADLAAHQALFGQIFQ